MFDFSKIKIVVWDLDDTFWSGTLSEGEVTPITANIQLIKRLTDCGIVNSICSKNDFEPTMSQLKAMQVDDCFVFPSIDWTPKGQRISAMLKTMGLRPQNCLFIDDNIQNLEEAKFSCQEIMTALPGELPELINAANNAQPGDLSHKRLKQYRILEEKATASANFADNTDFLFSSNIKVTIHDDCQDQIERIAELVMRSNQLNFTKRRDGKEQIQELVDDPSCQTGYVTVTDNFGDYGMVGFFAVKDGKCIHFLFSCRTIGQGVEEYVYATLGWPELTVVEPVINHVSKSPAPQWINQSTESTAQGSVAMAPKSESKIIFKGACDLGQMSEYVQSTAIYTEFTFIGKRRCNLIEHQTHSVNYLQWHFLSEAEQRNLVESLAFNDDEMFATRMYDEDVKLIVFSTMVEPNLGIYRNKQTGFRIAFGEYTNPLTDSERWQEYIENQVYTAQNNFTLDWLQRFSREYEFCGHLSPSEILENAKQTLKKVSPTASLCYILGPEIAYEGKTSKAYVGREKVYAEINQLFRDWAATEPRVLLLDVNDWVKSQKDFTNNINHWHRRIYFRMALKVNQYISQLSDVEIQNKSKLYLYTQVVLDKIKSSTGLRHTKFWRMLSNLKQRL